MSNAKILAAAQRTKQFNALIAAGLTLSSTDRQLQNGTLAFTGKVRVGRKTIRPTYAVTASGAVLSNEFVARRVDDDIVGSIDGYRQGLVAVSEILSKRVATA
jgi:hypothetical protein